MAQAFLLPGLINDTPEADARVPDRFRERQWSRVVEHAGGNISTTMQDSYSRPVDVSSTPTAAMTAFRACAADAKDTKDNEWIALCSGRWLYARRILEAAVP